MTLPLQHIDGPPSVQQNFDQIAQRFPINAPDLANGTQGTVFPTVPVNGQEFTYVADATNGVEWHFKYRTASASASKWEFVGGAPMFAEVLTDETTAAVHTTYQDLATVGPSITVPLAGDYEVMLCTAAYTATVNEQPVASVKFGAAATGDAECVVVTSSTANAQYATSRSYIRTGIAASALLKMQYRAGLAAQCHFLRRNLQVRPIRVT